MKSILIVALLVILDQGAKLLTVLKLKGNSAFPVFKGIFELTYVENTGVAFGIFANKQYGPILLSILTGIIFGISFR